VVNFEGYDISIKQYPHIIGDIRTFFSKEMFHMQDSVPVLNLKMGSDSYINQKISNKTISQIGQISEFKTVPNHD
jgi:hypothetical protein